MLVSIGLRAQEISLYLVDLFSAVVQTDPDGRLALMDILVRHYDEKIAAPFFFLPDRYHRAADNLDPALTVFQSQLERHAANGLIGDLDSVQVGDAVLAPLLVEHAGVFA